MSHANIRSDLEILANGITINWSDRITRERPLNNGKVFYRVKIEYSCCGKSSYYSALTVHRLRTSTGMCHHCRAVQHFAKINGTGVELLDVGHGYIGRNFTFYTSNEQKILEPMARFANCKVRRVLEHRAIMALHLGRPLTDEEIIHHKDGVHSNNRLENLELMNSTTHLALHNTARIEWFQFQQLQKNLVHWLI